MGELSNSRTWMMRLGFIALGTVIIFFHLLPLNTAPPRWAPPDVLIASAFAWSLRRPDYVPIVSLAAVMLMADLMYQRPPGLMAALVVLGCEYLKTRFGRLSDASFAGEWAAVCIVVVAITILNRMILILLGVDVAPLGLTLLQMIMTLAVYPVVVLVTQSVLGVRKLAPSDADALGTRA